MNNHVNMTGFSATPLDEVRVLLIGLGNRGVRALNRLVKLEGVTIVGLCDSNTNALSKPTTICKEYGNKPLLFSGSSDEWKKAVECTKADVIYIATPWDLHTEQALYGMQHGMHAFVEVPAATTIEECWALVKTSERTKRHCVQLENCCYDFHELTTLNLANKGYFGEIIHAEGAYIHDMVDLAMSDRFADHWQLKSWIGKMGNLYPTHGLGPICQAMNINRGDKLNYLVSVSTKDFIIKERYENTLKESNLLSDVWFNGNMNTSVLKTENGKTIVLQYDVSTPRPYTRGQLMTGTKASALKYPLPARISKGATWLEPKEQEELLTANTPELVHVFKKLALGIDNFGGMDLLMDWRNMFCLRSGLPMDQDVYDAALWSAITPLSIQSIQENSTSVLVPDFTSGNWKYNPPLDFDQHMNVEHFKIRL